MAASDTPAGPPLTEQGLGTPKQSSRTHTARAPSGRQPRRSSSQVSSDTDQLANNNPKPTRSIQNLNGQPNPLPVEEQLARVQTFCVYASKLVDIQREDIDRVSATVERIETELKSFRGFLEEMKQERRATHTGQKSNGMTSEEIDLLTSRMGDIGRKANEVDALKLELAMMKGKIRRLEHTLQQPTTATASFGGSDDDYDSVVANHNNTRAPRSHPTIRQPGRRPGRPRKYPINPPSAPLQERDGPIIENTNGHRISHIITDEVRNTTSHHPKQEVPERIRSKPSTQYLNQRKENLRLADPGKVDISSRHPQPRKRKREQSPSQDQGEESNQEDAIRARERVLDEEWRKDN
ncbi:MAG: hypothetical protein M1813_002933 [Trichoglossum hirsutum]|nr:MAG: hypothetical protein M1813_002933 [Trichoglossum hirsutum]